jgi:hypothetical protein
MTTGVSLRAMVTSSAEKGGEERVISIVHAGWKLRLSRIEIASISDYRLV